MNIAWKNKSAISKARKIYGLIDESLKEKMKDGDIPESLMTRFFCKLNSLLCKYQPKQANSSSILIDESVFCLHELASNVSHFRKQKSSNPTGFPTRDGRIVPIKRGADEMKETDESLMEVDTEDNHKEKNADSMTVRVNLVSSVNHINLAFNTGEF